MFGHVRDVTVRKFSHRLTRHVTAITVGVLDRGRGFPLGYECPYGRVRFTFAIAAKKKTTNTGLNGGFMVIILY